MIFNRLSDGIACPVIAPLASDAPLEARVQRAREAEAVRAGASLERAILEALLGRRGEAEALLARARARVPAESKGLLELASVLVMLEAGHPARMAGALERAEAVPGLTEEPTARALSLLFHAQLLLLEGAVADASRAATEGLVSLPPGMEREPLFAYAHLVRTECLLASGELGGAAVCAAVLERLPGVSGLLAARAELLRVRLALARGTPGPEELRASLDGALARLEALGASRDIALACLTRARVAALDGSEPPASWLARAQPLLARAGTAEDQRRLRQAFRELGRRKIDQLVDVDMVAVMETLRERHARLRDLLAAQRDARGPGQLLPASIPAPLVKAVDDLLGSMHSAEEELIGALEHTILDRERIGQLVWVCQELSSLEEQEALLEAIPRLATALLPSARFQFLEEGPTGLTVVSGERFSSGAPCPRLREAVEAALQAGAARVFREEHAVEPPVRRFMSSAGGRCAVVPLRDPGARRVLVVEQGGAEAPLHTSDLEQLTVFGSLVGAALARARSSMALRQAAARDAATLAAIRDGIITLDAQGRVLALNQAAARLLRVGASAVLGSRLRDFATLAPLAEALGSGKPLTDEVLSLPHGDILVRSQTYEGGVVATLQELATAQRLAHRLVGSPARFTFEELIGRAPVFLACLEDARRAACSDVPLLITGESGTGKEMLAQAIHRASPRAGAPFVGINVAAFPRELLESELFGYERGAFTGARAGGNPGKFELADRGTLLLDEIGDMPLEMQTRLLRVLQERAVQRLGGTRDIPITARLIATTHRDMEAAVEEGAFRLDLFHRLRVVHLRLPSLRERREDIPLLVEHHLRRQASRLGRPLRVAPHVMEALLRYDWPGNVRELANLLEGVVSLLPEDQDVIARVPPAIERALQRERPHAPASSRGCCPGPDEPVLPFDEVERRVFEHALKRCDGNVARAAKALGVAKGTFYSKIRRYGLLVSETSLPAGTEGPSPPSSRKNQGPSA
jgi:transcriptional regulator with PAS, ATPase and Fis domain